MGWYVLHFQPFFFLLHLMDFVDEVDEVIARLCCLCHFLDDLVDMPDFAALATDDAQFVDQNTDQDHKNGDRKCCLV